MRALALALLIALAACAPRADGNARVLTYASPYAPGHPFSRADRIWIKYVEAHSAGRLKIKPYWSGVLLSSDQSMEEVRHGVADIGLITPIYERGGAHLLRDQSGYYGGVRSMEDQVAIYKCLGAEFPEFAAELEGLHVLAVQGGNFPGVLTRTRPVRTLADFRGLRLRAPAELTGVLRQLGADPVDMPMSQVYSAMSKNVIDGVVAPTDTLKSLHFGEIAHYYSTLHVPRGAYPARAMALAAWKSLPPDLQAVLDDSAAVWERALAQELDRAAKSGAAYGRQAGIAFAPFDSADQARFDALYNASALANARALKEVGIDGEPVFRRAQALIHAGAGVLASCGEGKP
ncbi:MAG TPA: TRAP transporter substrate-binding protein DctP [Caulobacterales bacterium]|jgi:TRAP-type C4-dicarboxylate transport system substrate-binding protein|nr:TRAP transporter substrate-binding protein DctP [Caulobacterales bacterium]